MRACVVLVTFVHDSRYRFPVVSAAETFWRASRVEPVAGMVMSPVVPSTVTPADRFVQLAITMADVFVHVGSAIGMIVMFEKVAVPADARWKATQSVVEVAVKSKYVPWTLASVERYWVPPADVPKPA